MTSSRRDSAFTGLTVVATTLALVLPACKPTYKRSEIREDIRQMAQKETGTAVEVAEAGKTIGLRFLVPDLASELSSGNNELYEKMNGLFLVLVRVALSSDDPPEFIILDIVDEQRPLFHLTFTRNVDDIRRAMAEAISHDDAQDRLLEEIVVGKRRVPFDPYELDIVRLVMMSADASSSSSEIEPFTVEEVRFSDFVAKVAENKARRIVRSRKETKNDFMLREVRAGFDPTGGLTDDFRILLDLVSTSDPRPSLPVLEKLLPVVGKEIGELFRSYRFKDFSQILVVEKNTGKMIAIAAN